MAEQNTNSFAQIMLATREEAHRAGQSYLGVEHVFMALCRLGGSTENLLRAEGLDPRAVRGAVHRAVDHRFAREDGLTIAITPRLQALLAPIIHAAHEQMTPELAERQLLAAILREGQSTPMRVLRKRGVDPDKLLADLESKDGQPRRSGAPGAASGCEEAQDSEGLKALECFGRDLTRLAREGKIHPVIGRDDEVRRLQQTLVRVTKCNPVLLGEAGVGKTAILEGLAYQIANGNVIPELLGKHLIEINLALVICGTKYRGAFEENLIKILDVARQNPDIILAIDELHTLVGSGGPPGGLDSSNIMKPALARGEIRLIGATTRDEYRRYIEPDAALERRFQPIVVDEPSPADTFTVLAGIRGRFEKHHHVSIADAVLHSAIDLSVRFLPARRLPDKAIDLLDEACAYARVHESAAAEGSPPAPHLLQVESSQVASVLTEWTGLPVSELSDDLRQRLIRMPGILSERVIGQEEAIGVLSRMLESALSGLRHGDRPIAVLLFVGPSGVGKTELAKALAQFLFGSDKQLIRLDMSEYQEKHEVAKLIGAPPGYVGHQEAGFLTESLRKKPYSVVLFDEVEKAHPDVFDVLLQLFSDGRLTDAHGRTADGTNAIFIMTSNLGSGLYHAEHSIGFARDAPGAVHNEEIIGECKRFFRPEFINRIDEIVVFKPLGPAQLERIVHRLCEELSAELAPKGITIELTAEAIVLLAREGYESMYGARPLRRTFERLVVQPVAHRIVCSELIAGERVTVGVVGGSLVIAKQASQ